MRPYQNAREIIKQLAMLEDHLNNAHKRCADCITKHFLMTEGLAEELGSLCVHAGTNSCRDLASKIRVLHHAWASDPKDERVVHTVGQELRAARKSLMKPFAVLPVDKLPSNETAKVKALLRRCKMTATGGKRTCKAPK
jgi:hypothetical protein